MAIDASVDIVSSEIERELAAQLQHFDSLDSKAGIVLGLSGVLVALTGAKSGLAIDLLRGLAACAALCALFASLPRRLASMNVRVLRDRYLQSDLRFTKRVLVDTHIKMVQDTSAALQTKARWLKGSIAFIALATVMAAALLPWFEGGR